MADEIRTEKSLIRLLGLFISFIVFVSLMLLFYRILDRIEEFIEKMKEPQEEVADLITCTCNWSLCLSPYEYETGCGEDYAIVIHNSIARGTCTDVSLCKFPNGSWGPCSDCAYGYGHMDYFEGDAVFCRNPYGCYDVEGYQPQTEVKVEQKPVTTYRETREETNYLNEYWFWWLLLCIAASQ